MIKIINNPVKAWSDKLLVLLDNPCNTPDLAWPTDAVYAKDRTTVIGCRVPYVARKQALTNLYSINPANCCIHANYEFRVDIAINLAKAYQRIHQHGCVLGDGSPKNTFQGRDASVCLIDLDSIQITRDGFTHRCNVCTPEYTPPDFQGISDLSTIDRAAEYDAFASRR